MTERRRAQDDKLGDLVVEFSCFAGARHEYEGLAL
jgi:hypothetical protein